MSCQGAFRNGSIGHSLDPPNTTLPMSVPPSVGPTLQPSRSCESMTHGTNWNSFCCCCQGTAGLPPTKCKLQAHQHVQYSYIKKKQTNCGQNKPIMILSLSYTTHLEIPTQTNGGCFFRAWSRHPRPSRTDWIGHWAEHCVPSFSSNPQVKSSA